MPKFVVMGPDGTKTDITDAVNKSTSKKDIKAAVVNSITYPKGINLKKQGKGQTLSKVRKWQK